MQRSKQYLKRDLLIRNGFLYITKHRTLPVRSKMWQSQYLLPRSQCLLSKASAYLLKTSALLCLSTLVILKLDSLDKCAQGQCVLLKDNYWYSLMYVYSTTSQCVSAYGPVCWTLYNLGFSLFRKATAILIHNFASYL